eukprot:11225643-Lingulodinium_polyedra.AAC.1
MTHTGRRQTQTHTDTCADTRTDTQRHAQTRAIRSQCNTNANAKSCLNPSLLGAPLSPSLVKMQNAMLRGRRGPGRVAVW